ncbi:MAG TPA: M28 family peptidase [Bryobacteraceae bacterium]|nr:hypothetical protein [Bryobacterales bacterium]HRJ20829.1 M28 family peptidase [Bryobacteraceae bacterium]
MPGRIIACFLLLMAGANGQTQLHYERVVEGKIRERFEMVHPEMEERYRRLKAMFENAGCTGDRLSEQPVRREKYPNLVCVLPGETEEEYLVGAHFDYFRGEGALDNWSGASLLPSLYESLAKTQRKHTFRFVAFTAEEKGLVGSRFYAERVKKGTLPRPKAMINLDCLGLGQPNLWFSGGDLALNNRIHSLAVKLQIKLSLVDIGRVGTTDSESFRKIGVPAATVHSVTQETLNIINSDNDTREKLKFGDYYDTYRLLALTLASLDVLPVTFPAAGK